MMIPSTDPQVRGGLGLGTRQCARPGTKSAAARLVWVTACLVSPGSLGAGTMVLWGAATMGAAASPSEASQPSGTLSMFLSVLVWALATANQKPHVRPVWALRWPVSRRYSSPSHVSKPSAPVGYNYRYRYNSHPERPFMVMFMLGSACCATHWRALSNN